MSDEIKVEALRKLEGNRRSRPVDEHGFQIFENALNQNKSLAGRFCSRPFEFLEIQDRAGQGNVHLCCPTWLARESGSLLDSSISTIFNSKTSREIRESIFDGSFRFCNKKICPQIQNNSLPFLEDIEDPYLKKIIETRQTDGLSPKFYNLCYDKSCNLSCPSCRTLKILHREGPAYDHKERIQKSLIKDLFEQPHDRSFVVNLTGSGDPFGSKLFRQLLFSIDGKKFPNLKINLQTNGVMFTPKNWEKMHKIHDNIDTVLISLDAATPRTYPLIRRGGNWNALRNNLDFIAGELRANGLINYLRLDFVVQQLNYREMPEFVRLGKQLEVDYVYFCLLVDWGTWSPDLYDKNAVWQTTHPEFPEFLEVLKDPLLGERIVDLGNVQEYRDRAII